jgi:hypothetical protein
MLHAMLHAKHNEVRQCYMAEVETDTDTEKT